MEKAFFFYRDRYFIEGDNLYMCDIWKSPCNSIPNIQWCKLKLI